MLYGVYMNRQKVILLSFEFESTFILSLKYEI